MLNLRTAMPIVKLFNARFYISVYNVVATLRYCRENTLKLVISVVASVNHAETTPIEIRMTQLSNALT